MKPKLDEDDYWTGDDAVQYLTENWDSVGMGMVNVEVQDLWLIVRRSGGDFSTFLSLVDGTAVTILSDSATTRHVPKHLRPDGELTAEEQSSLGHAFRNTGGGVYPLRDEGVFSVGFIDEDEHMELLVGLTDDRLKVRAR